MRKHAKAVKENLLNGGDGTMAAPEI